MSKLSADDALYENLRTDLYRKLTRLPFHTYRTVDGVEHTGHVVSPGLMTQLVMVLKVPLNPPGVHKNPERDWLLPKGYEEPGVPFPEHRK